MQEVVDKVNHIVNIFLEKGCSFDDAESFIMNNLDYLDEMGNNLEDKIFLVCNNKRKYALLLVDGDNYNWSIYGKDGFQKLKNVDSEEDVSEVEKTDFVIEMMLNFSKKSTVVEAVPEINNMNMEGKVKTLKKIGLNSNGYHFK